MLSSGQLKACLLREACRVLPTLPELRAQSVWEEQLCCPTASEANVRTRSCPVLPCRPGKGWHRCSSGCLQGHHRPARGRSTNSVIHRAPRLRLCSGGSEGQCPVIWGQPEGEQRLPPEGPQEEEEDGHDCVHSRRRHWTPAGPGQPGCRKDCSRHKVSMASYQ